MLNRKQSFYVLSQDDIDRITSLLENVQEAVYSIIFAKQVKYSNDDTEQRLPPFCVENQIHIETQRPQSETFKPIV